MLGISPSTHSPRPWALCCTSYWQLSSSPHRVALASQTSQTLPLLVILAGVEAAAAVVPWMQSVGKYRTCRRRQQSIHTDHTDWASKIRQWQCKGHATTSTFTLMTQAVDSAQKLPPIYQTARGDDSNGGNPTVAHKVSTKVGSYNLTPTFQALKMKLWCVYSVLYHKNAFHPQIGGSNSLNTVKNQVKNFRNNTVMMNSCNRQKWLYYVVV